MMRKRFIPVLMFGLLVGFYAQAQETLPPFHEFMLLVKKNHPYSKQALLSIEQEEKSVMKARGAFDPKIGVDVSEKFFDDKHYYTLSDYSLGIPTILGMELKGGLNSNEGLFLNPENATPENGLVYAGLSMNLGRGLFIDERRRDLRLAKNAVTQAENYYRSGLNDLLKAATDAYWEYYFTSRQRVILASNAENARVRFEGIRQSFINGDIPAIDTLEAYVQWQTRLISLADARAKQQKSYNLLATFLWSEAGRVVDQNCCPTVSIDSFDSIVLETSPEQLEFLKDDIETGHPKMMAFQQKEIALSIERKWYVESLKPQVKVHYQFLSEPVDGTAFEGVNFNDYKWGLGVKMPLFLRKERANVGISNIKLERNDWERQLQLVELLNKFEAYRIEYSLLREQYERIADNVRYAERLLEAEQIKFSIGESSIFLINSRENQLISLQLKYQETLLKLLKSYYAVIWSSGTLADQ